MHLSLLILVYLLWQLTFSANTSLLLTTHWWFLLPRLVGESDMVPGRLIQLCFLCASKKIWQQKSLSALWHLGITLSRCALSFGNIKFFRSKFCLNGLISQILVALKSLRFPRRWQAEKKIIMEQQEPCCELCCTILTLAGSRAGQRRTVWGVTVLPAA